MQEELSRIVANLDRYSAVQLHVAMNGAFADFVLYGGEKAAELEAAGFHEQAVELRRRLAEMMPPDAPAIAPLSLPAAKPNVPAVNGVTSGPLSPQPRRGRPPKNQAGGGPTS